MTNSPKQTSEWTKECLPAHLSAEESRGIAFTIPVPEASTPVFSTSPILDALARRETLSET